MDTGNRHTMRFVYVMISADEQFSDEDRQQARAAVINALLDGIVEPSALLVALLYFMAQDDQEALGWAGAALARWPRYKAWLHQGIACAMDTHLIMQQLPPRSTMAAMVRLGVTSDEVARAEMTDITWAPLDPTARGAAFSAGTADGPCAPTDAGDEQ